MTFIDSFSELEEQLKIDIPYENAIWHDLISN